MGLVDYDSDSSGQQSLGNERDAGTDQSPPRKEDSDDSYFVNSDSESEDSAARRAREARERLDALDQASSRDRASGSTGPSRLLPDPMAAYNALQSKPGYLDPEATRPIAAPIHSSRAPVAPGDRDAHGAAEDGPSGKGGTKRAAEWDISMMAPPLKGQPAPAKRGVISAAAKLNRPLGEDSGIVTAAQVAMLGGQWRPSESSGEVEQQGRNMGPSLPPSEKDKARRATKAMPVAEALASGAALPRRHQSLKEKQKAKADQGRRATGEWKSEAFMILRQQYD
eukprot:jgi/Botrbrau1/22937/Bobra.0030s0014.1